MTVKLGTVDKLKREIQRTKNHLQALEDILAELEEEAPPRRPVTSQNSHIDLMEKALKRVKGNKVFSVKQITAYAREIDSSVDRRIIYNSIRSYLQTGVKYNEYEQVSDTEYRRVLE